MKFIAELFANVEGGKVVASWESEKPLYKDAQALVSNRWCSRIFSGYKDKTIPHTYCFLTKYGAVQVCYREVSNV